MDAKELYLSDEIHCVGGIHFFSSLGLAESSLTEDALAAAVRGDIVVPEKGSLLSIIARHRFCAKYEDVLEQTGSEPEWINQCHPNTRRSLRLNRFISDVDPLAINSDFPWTGFGYVIPEGEMIEDAARNLELFRLHRVKQLGFLENPTVGEQAQTICSSTYSHTRYLHSLDVCALATLMGNNCGLSDDDMRHLQFAALMHDVLTPAGSDSIKRTAVTLFDEDASFPVIFKLEKWPAFQQCYGLREDYLTEIILGKGILGRVLDLADKLAYIARDVSYFLRSIDGRTPDGLGIEQSVIRDIVAYNDFVCGLWGQVRIVDGQLVLTNPKTLAVFLKLRALMFKALYYNPSSRFNEDVVLRLVGGHLLENGTLTKSMLLLGGDWLVTDALDGVLGTYGLTTMINSPFEPRVETFATLAELKSREQEFLSQRNLLTHAVARKPLTSTGADSFKLYDHEHVRSLRELCPEDVAEIEKIMISGNSHWLYIFSIENVVLPPELLKQLREARRKRLHSITP